MAVFAADGEIHFSRQAEGGAGVSQRNGRTAGGPTGGPLGGAQRGGSGPEPAGPGSNPELPVGRSLTPSG